MTKNAKSLLKTNAARNANNSFAQFTPSNGPVPSAAQILARMDALLAARRAAR